jgi:hypothetical protein
MEAQQTATKVPLSPNVSADPVARQKYLTYLQDNYITFCASSGLSQDEDGNFVTMTVKQFAAAAGVDRATLYRWQKSIPDFWTKVDERAKQIFNQSTKFAIFKGLKLKAMTGDVKAAEMVLSHYSDYTPPAQKHEVKLSGWGDMVREARKAQIKNDRPAQEAEIIEQFDEVAAKVSNPQPLAAPMIPTPMSASNQSSPQVIPPSPTEARQELSPKLSTQQPIEQPII